MSALDRNAAGIAALTDPVRRALYRMVAAAPEPVSRDQAADAVGIARHQAKFHLDKLEAEGLLESDYARLTGRSGPGAGRTAKRYRRAPVDIEVSVPPRTYRLASQLMADAIAEAAISGAPVAEVLNRTAREFGIGVGQAAAGNHPAGDPAAALGLLTDALDGYGYEPQRRGDEVQLTNCPFHAVAQAQPELACAMSHALISGAAQALAPHCPQAQLDPAPGRCCVVLSSAPD
ncbi:helix-turn-helix domain-containing protein [Mycobacterium sp. M1]|uniref:Helix-turn-helix domain-containing protein n=2 Tax=Mycolicibacter acidiphilus TaxID=2835306 RepID=A0ABS5RGK9_9MYCO|nr:helix-turn-helix domain-containing protein [Mycolicibacter acidiphilus]